MVSSFTKILGEWLFFLILIGSHIRMKDFLIEEQCSNLQDITNVAKEGFGKPSLILVQANGLKIEDSPVTQCVVCITSVLLIYSFIFIIFWIVIRNVKHWALSWKASTSLMIQLRQWEVFDESLLGNLFKPLIHASLFSALQFWKCSARKKFAVEKEEVSTKQNDW